MSSESPSSTAAPAGTVILWIAVVTALVGTAGLLVGGGGWKFKVRLADGPFSHFCACEDWAYGWPLVFLWREDRTDWSVTPPLEQWGSEDFSLAALGVDLLVGGLFVALGVGVVWWWRRSRQHWLQVYLSELLGLTATVACGAAWLVWNHQLYGEHAKIAAEVRELADGSNSVRWEEAGPDWLRTIAPQLLRDFDRVADANILPRELPKIAQLKTVKHVNVFMGVTEERDLLHLAQLPELEGLRCDIFTERWVFVPEQGSARPPRPALLPSLPRLRFLSLGGAALDPRCAERLPNVEAIDLCSGNDLPQDPSVEALVRMKRLRHLWLWREKISDAALARLRSKLPECEIVVK